MSLSAITLLRAWKLGDVELPSSGCREFRATVRMCRCDAPPTSVKPFLSIGNTCSLHLSSSPGISASLSREMEITKGLRLKLKPSQDRNTYAKPRSHFSKSAIESAGTERPDKLQVAFSFLLETPFITKKERSKQLLTSISWPGKVAPEWTCTFATGNGSRNV